MAHDFNQPIVIDNGSGILKAGFAGSDEPKLLSPAFVGQTKYKHTMVGGEVEKDYLVGNEAQTHRGILRLSYPTSHGVTTDWDGMTALWNYAYKELNVQLEEHPVLLTEPPLNSKRQRLQTLEIFYEQFNAPALSLQVQAILSLYASGKTTGIVLDSGDGVTHAVPVYEGFAIPHAITRIDVGGRDVTEYLQLLLRKAGHNFHTSAELEVVKAIKESEICHVAFNLEKSEKENAENDKENEQGTEYKLPDGSSIKIGAERFRAPELLFNPSLIGLEYPGAHQCLVNAISKSDLDIRRTLYSEIVLAGGSTLFQGFGDRLLLEVKKNAPSHTKIRIYAPPERLKSTWVGGSILASLATFKNFWVTRKQYDELGPEAVFRKSF